MKIFALLVFALFAAPLSALAQINSPFDPNCYFPQFSNPDEIETIEGTRQGQLLGQYLTNAGPDPVTGYDRLWVQGWPGNTANISVVFAGPGVTLHSAKSKKAGFLPEDFRYGRFRTFRKGYLDFCLVNASRVWIYWADEQGNLDSNRVSLINGLDGVSQDPVVGPWVYDQDGDGLDDIVIGFAVSEDTGYAGVLSYFRGGADLRPDIASPVPSEVLPIGTGNPDFTRYLLPGDYRGTGRQDLIMSTYESQDFFFFGNDAPFTLEKLRDAILHDTLIAHWENPNFLFGGTDLYNGLAVRALPKSASDRSQDFVIGVGDTADYDSHVRFFRGGPDFGKKKIKWSEPDYVIHSIKNQGFSDNGGFGRQLSTITNFAGKGETLLIATAPGGGATYDLMYELGDSLDEKAEVAVVYPHEVHGGGLGGLAKIDLNNDGLTDQVWGDGGYLTNKGRVGVLWGNRNIKLKNTVYSAPKNLGSPAFYPTPAIDFARFRLLALPLKVQAIGLSGARFAPALKALGGDEYEIDLRSVRPGAYLLTIQTAQGAYTSKILKL